MAAESTIQQAAHLAAADQTFGFSDDELRNLGQMSAKGVKNAVHGRNEVKPRTK